MSRSDTTLPVQHVFRSDTKVTLCNTCLGQTQRLPCATCVSVKHCIHLVPHVSNPNTTFYNTYRGQKQHSFCTHVSMPDTTFTFYHTCLSQIQHSLCTEPRVHVRQHSHCTVFLSSSHAHTDTQTDTHTSMRVSEEERSVRDGV